MLNKSPLTSRQILAWADAHYQRTGQWPMVKSGPVYGVRGITWQILDQALRCGTRGLPGGSSLRQLLAKKRGIKPHLTYNQVLAWANEHHDRTGKWPTVRSGVVHVAPLESWLAIDRALRRGARGLPGGTSLFRLLLNSVVHKDIMVSDKDREPVR